MMNYKAQVGLVSGWINTTTWSLSVIVCVCVFVLQRSSRMQCRQSIGCPPEYFPFVPKVSKFETDPHTCCIFHQDVDIYIYIYIKATMGSTCDHDCPTYETSTLCHCTPRKARGSFGGGEPWAKGVVKFCFHTSASDGIMAAAQLAIFRWGPSGNKGNGLPGNRTLHCDQTGMVLKQLEVSVPSTAVPHSDL